MPNSQTTKHTDRTNERNLSTLDFHFAFEPEFVFAYSPDALRAVCNESNQLMRLFVLRMGEMLAVTLDTPAIKRIGFVRALSERDWLQRMIRLARGEEAFNYDPDESCYAELNAIRQAKNVATEARRASRRESLGAKRAGVPASSNATEDEGPLHKEKETEEQAEPEHFLQGFRMGQLQITNFITRCQVLRVGARGKGRQKWTEDAPLIVRDVSGFKHNELVIAYSGQELRPKDLVTWTKLLQMAVPSPLGTKVSISKARLLFLRGGADGGNSVAAAVEEIERLQNAWFRMTIKCPRVISLIADGCPDDKCIQDARKTGLLSMSFHLLGQTTTSGRVWTIHVDPMVRLLFGKGLSSWFDERVYKKINGDFAKRLYLLYYSHKDCYPLTLSELRKFLGSTMTSDNKFKEAVDVGHQELENIKAICSGWELKESPRRFGFLAYEITRPVNDELEMEED